MDYLIFLFKKKTTNHHFRTKQALTVQIQSNSSNNPFKSPVKYLDEIPIRRSK
jgi:hypothetical protein